jgi:uncharacterized protein with von Willebrand factor type A (vWA) domain
MTAAPHRDLERNMVEFCRLLRERDLLVTPAEVIDALRTAESIDLTDRTEMKLALRSVLTAQRDDVPVFDATFDEFWRSRALEGGDDHFTTRSVDLNGRGQPISSVAHAADGDDTERHEGFEAPESSPIEVLARHDFRDFKPDQLDEIKRAVLLMAHRLAARQRSRRSQITRRGQLIDLRRTLRRNIKYGGTVIELAHKRRKRRKPRLVLLCDVSRSMELYSTFLLQFIYALQNTGLRLKVESFVFSTRLTRVTDYFKANDIATALERIAREVPDWTGGTRIGDSFLEFNRRWAPRVLDRHTIVLVLSDGLDSGQASVLGTQVEELERRAARVVWLNPLLGEPGYRPIARTMRAALQHVAVFAPANNLASLQVLGKLLAVSD